MIGCLPTQSLALFAVFIYATHATQAIAFGWKPGLTVNERRHQYVKHTVPLPLLQLNGSPTFIEPALTETNFDFSTRTVPVFCTQSEKIGLKSANLANIFVSNRWYYSKGETRQKCTVFG